MFKEFQVEFMQMKIILSNCVVIFVQLVFKQSLYGKDSFKWSESFIGRR